MGDLIVEIDGGPVDRWSDLHSAVAASEGAALDLTPQRGDQTRAAALAPELHGDRWLIGVGAARYFTLQTALPSPMAAFSDGLSQSWDLLKATAGGLTLSLLGRGDPDSDSVV